MTHVKDLVPLRSLTRLERLALAQTEVTDIKPLAAMTNLRWLHISYTDVRDFSPLEKLTKMEEIVAGKSQLANAKALAEKTGIKVRLSGN